jgi:adenylate kinase family enzyme
VRHDDSAPGTLRGPNHPIADRANSVKRVVVVGPPGSGKTTIGRAIGEKLGIPHVEIDSLWWEPNWTEVGSDVLKERAAKVAARDAWVMDGNYFSVGAREAIWPRADTIVWLDPSRRVAMWRVVSRTLMRIIRRTELWSGNRESVRGMLARDSLIWFAWREYPKYGQRYGSLEHDPEFAHLTWVRLRTSSDVRSWLSRLPTDPRGPSGKTVSSC